MILENYYQVRTTSENGKDRTKNFGVISPVELKK